jgi:hypothetical protein
VSHAGGELERRQESAPAPYVRPGRRGEAAKIIDWPELLAWVQRRGLILGGLALIVAQLIWKSIFLGHYYFWQDDFNFLEIARAHSYSWSYLTYVGAGHLTPGDWTIFWILARISPYNWGLCAGITVVLLAATGLAAFRLLHTLFGHRPAILVPLVVYLFTPLTMPNIRWWSSAMESLPLQLATFMILTAWVHYVRTRRFLHAVAATAWLVVGLLFFEKAVVLPLILLGVTSGFLMEGRWLPAIRRCLVTYWRAWAMLAAALVAYVIVFALSLHTSKTQPGAPGSAGAVFSFIVTLTKDTFVPGAIGGPWQWAPSSDFGYGYSAPPPALAWLALLAAAAVVAASIWYRRYAWRAWAILAVWLVAADITPVLLGRISELGPAIVGMETRYVSDAAPLLAVCLGLAFWPPSGQPDLARGRVVVGLSQWGRTAAAGLVGAFIIGSLWSVQAFQTDTTDVPVRSWIANASLALAEAPPGTVIVDQGVPQAVMTGLFGSTTLDSRVLGLMDHTGIGTRIRFTQRPAGTIDGLLIFGADGRLRRAAVYGKTSVLPPGSCQRVKHGQAVVRFATPTWSTTLVLHVPYAASPGVGGDVMTVTYGASSQQFTVRAGLHDVWLPERGSVSSVTLSGPALSGTCVGVLQAGAYYASASGPVIPPVY